jgi:hypothetical protein
MQNLKIKMDANLKAINEMQESFERWKIIDDYDNYSVSSFGRVRNDTTGRILKACNNGHGYYIIGLTNNYGKKKANKVHRLIATAFIDNPNNKPFVDHFNNDKLNNNITNLRWVTNTENIQNSKLRIDNACGIKGVYWYKQTNKWTAQIRIDKILIHLGYFDDIEDAKKARIDRATKEFGVYKNACEKQ